MRNLTVSGSAFSYRNVVALAGMHSSASREVAMLRERLADAIDFFSLPPLKSVLFSAWTA